MPDPFGAKYSLSASRYPYRWRRVSVQDLTGWEWLCTFLLGSPVVVHRETGRVELLVNSDFMGAVFARPLVPSDCLLPGMVVTFRSDLSYLVSGPSFDPV